MSLAQIVNQIANGNWQVANRPAQVYSNVIGAYTVFNTVGAVEIVVFGGLVTAAAGGVTTVTSTFNGVAGDAGATAINGAVGTIVWIPLNVAGTLLNAAAIPKTLATSDAMIVGMGTGTTPGNIVLTFATSTWTGEWFCVYRKLSSQGRVY